MNVSTLENINEHLRNTKKSRIGIGWLAVPPFFFSLRSSFKRMYHIKHIKFNKETPSDLCPLILQQTNFCPSTVMLHIYICYEITGHLINTCNKVSVGFNFE